MLNLLPPVETVFHKLMYCWEHQVAKGKEFIYLSNSDYIWGHIYNCKLYIFKDNSHMHWFFNCIRSSWDKNVGQKVKVNLCPYNIIIVKPGYIALHISIGIHVSVPVTVFSAHRKRPRWICCFIENLLLWICYYNIYCIKMLDMKYACCRVGICCVGSNDITMSLCGTDKKTGWFFCWSGKMSIANVFFYF